MTYRLGVEDIETNHWVAFVFDHPGCFSSATTREEAIANAPARIDEYFEWLLNFVDEKPARNKSTKVRLTEVIHSYRSVADPDYIVNAFFKDDGKPLTRVEVDVALVILSWAQLDLNTLVENIPVKQLNEPLVGDDENSIAKILDHLAWAEWWYFNRLDLGFPRSEMPPETRAKLEKVHAQTRALVPNLVGDTRVFDKVGEKWTARKVLRRTLWHERDHTRQIRGLL